jgi:hypothetical protein
MSREFDTNQGSYREVKEVGRGSFGIVVLMRNKGVEQLVVKQFPSRGHLAQETQSTDYEVTFGSK